MTIDIHKLVNGKAQDLLFSIGDQEYFNLELAISNYKNKTGIFIDQYSDTKLTCGIDVLISSIKESMKNHNENKTQKELINILSEAINSKYCVIFVGD